MGNKFSDTMSYFELQFNRWSWTDPKGNPCKPSQVIDAAIDSSSIGIAMVNTYFDFDDYSSPIKTYIDDRLFYNFMSGFTKEAYVFIQENTAEQRDSLFRYSPSGNMSSFICKQIK